jgi:hypothetical protein
MPRIRDLGINAIPATMRPPEIGRGGYAAAQCAPGTGGSAGCQEGTCDAAMDIDDCGAGTGASVGCQEGTCGQDDCGAGTGGSVGCQEGTCQGKPHGGHKKSTADHSLSALAAAQLRQQLEQHIANT